MHSGFAARAAWLAGLIAVSSAWAGGTAEHALILVDPTQPDAMYLANYYAQQRDVPPENFLYMFPAAASYNAFIADNLEAVFGELARRGASHIDYIIIAPTDQFFIPSSGTVSDACFPVNRFSLTGAYTLAFVTDQILSGISSIARNQYFKGNNDAPAFSASTAWLDGSPSTAPNARRYFLGAQLGYTGQRGNTPAELVTMIDRAVAADGSQPLGTFYYCQTTDQARSGPRHGQYPARVADIIALGGQAEHLMANLPTGEQDVLGIMTGLANPAIAGANMTILPGAFCDHLTSFAARFDISNQVKVSEWIRNGAGGSWGTVEEPCNYLDKFPHPRVHINYFRGLPLGDAVFRGIRGMPFQGMLYGDPLTRTHAAIPTVDVPDAPVGAVSGTVTLTPAAAATAPGALIEQIDLLIDGRIVDSIGPGGAFAINTSQLSDGWHDVRVLATDNTLQATSGRWIGALRTSNHGTSIGATPLVTSGDLSTAFSVSVTASGPGVSEIRLVHNGRVIDAAQASSGVLSASGYTIGAGPARVFAEALLDNGRTVRSLPIDLEIAYAAGSPSGAAPTAASYTKRVDPTVGTTLLELPADHDDSGDPLTWTVLSGPAQATVGGSPAWGYRFLRPDAGATGTDVLTYRVSSAAGTSNTATVTIVYAVGCPGDVDGDGTVGITDLGMLLPNFGTPSGASREDGDLNGDGAVDIGDLGELLAHFGAVCS